MFTNLITLQNNLAFRIRMTCLLDQNIIHTVLLRLLYILDHFDQGKIVERKENSLFKTEHRFSLKLC